MERKIIKFCEDCQKPSTYHIRTWLDTLISQLLPSISLSKKAEQLLNLFIEKLLISLRLVSLKDDFAYADIQLRAACFIKEAKKEGIKFKTLCSPFGYINHFQAKINNKTIRFEGLPIANFTNKYRTETVDNKEKTKKLLKKNDFPVANGKAFWFWQKKQALNFGIKQLNFPLVVKPRDGSVSRHVTTNIKSKRKLKKAIDKAIAYSPVFIIEKFIPNTFVHRATVIDFNPVACVKQVPANIVGDGALTIQKLINKKNNNPRREENLFHKIVLNKTTEKLLDKKGYNLSSIPKKEEVVYLQEDSFLKLGGDLVELTPKVHPDNIKLFSDIAKLFKIKVVGIDFLIKDVSKSWRIQQSAVLELNSLPCIELHHFPSSGKPQNVAREITKLFFKYYI